MVIRLSFDLGGKLSVLGILEYVRTLEKQKAETKQVANWRMKRNKTQKNGNQSNK